MPTLKIDDKEYELDLLSAEAKAQLVSLQMTDSEIQRLQVQLAIAQTARSVVTPERASLKPCKTRQWFCWPVLVRQARFRLRVKWQSNSACVIRP